MRKYGASRAPMACCDGRVHCPQGNKFGRFLSTLMRGRSVHCGRRIVSVSMRGHLLHASGNSRCRFSHLVDDLPLPRMVGVLGGIPISIYGTTAQLRYAYNCRVSIKLGAGGVPPCL